MTWNCPTLLATTETQDALSVPQGGAYDNPRLEPPVSQIHRTIHPPHNPKGRPVRLFSIETDSEGEVVC